MLFFLQLEYEFVWIYFINFLSNLYFSIYWLAWCWMKASVKTCALTTFGANFWATGIEIWICLHFFTTLLHCWAADSFSIYCDLAWYSIMETIIFSTWVVTSSVETCALTTFGANFWARGFVFSVHWATLLLIASGVSSKLFLKY